MSYQPKRIMVADLFHRLNFFVFDHKIFGSLVLGSRLTIDYSCKSGGGFKMSGDDGTAAAAVEEKLLHCASCGKAEIDDIKLKDCNSCDLVRYCSDDCQQDHKSEHEGECKIRAAELPDELLFKQPESTHLGDCPICMLPLSGDDESKRMTRPCCCKFVCEGCDHQSAKLAMKERRPYPECPYCREPVPTGENMIEVLTRQLRKRAKTNDPEALYQMGHYQYEKGDYSGAFKWYTKAAELGHASAHVHLAKLYAQGKGVEKDNGKEIHHLEEAAIGGHPDARHALSLYEFNRANVERAVKHSIIAANLGQEESMQFLTRIFKVEGIVGRRSISKEDFAAVLRRHYAAVKATKSPEREEAAAFHGRQH